MLSSYRWLSLIATGLLAIACNIAPSPLTQAAASLEDARSYRIEYRLTTFLEGMAKPVVASGQAEFEGANRWIVRQDSIEMVNVGPAVYVRNAGNWRIEEMVELPIHPLLYLKAAENVRRGDSNEAHQTFSFTLDREKYRRSLAQAFGNVPSGLNQVIAGFSGAGEIVLNGYGQPTILRLHLENSAMGPGKTRQELEVRFLELGGQYQIQVPLDVQQPMPGGQNR